VPEVLSAAPTRTELGLVGRAARQHWPMSPEQQATIVATLLRLVGDPSTKPRTAIAATKALASLGRLALDQQRLDQAEAEQTAPPAASFDVRDALLWPGDPGPLSEVEVVRLSAWQEYLGLARTDPAAYDRRYREDSAGGGPGDRRAPQTLGEPRRC
jgi:hypothetical protein